MDVADLVTAPAGTGAAVSERATFTEEDTAAAARGVSGMVHVPPERCPAAVMTHPGLLVVIVPAGNVTLLAGWAVAVACWMGAVASTPE